MRFTHIDASVIPLESRNFLSITYPEAREIMLVLPRQNALSYPPPGVTPNYVDPVSRGPQLEAVSIALLVVAFLFVMTRLATKIYVTRSLGADDFFSVAALVCQSLYDDDVLLF